MDEFNVTMNSKVVFNPNTNSRQNLNINNESANTERIHTPTFNMRIKEDSQPKRIVMSQNNPWDYSRLEKDKDNHNHHDNHD